MKIKEGFRAFINIIEYKKANRSWEGKRKYLEKRGATIGAGTRLNCSTDSFGTEPYLIKCGKDCLFANGVHFYTHDGGIKVLNTLNMFDGKRMEKFGAIVVGDNVYIGSETLIMPGVTIGDNCIIAAGAVVTHDVPSNTVWGGVPAKQIKSLDDYYQSTLEKIGGGGVHCFEGYSMHSKKEHLIRTLMQHG